MMFYNNYTLLQELLPNGYWKDVGYGMTEMYFDCETYGSKIDFTNDDGHLLSTSAIGVDTVMQLDENQCTWKAVELVTHEGYWRDLRITFPSNDIASQFYQKYLLGISYAQEWEVDEMTSTETEENN